MRKSPLSTAVVFYIDPAIVHDPAFEAMRTITLSYTYFPARGGEQITTSSIAPIDVTSN